MRSWPGLAAMGAGLIHLGVAAASPPLLLMAFALVGAVETGWGVAALGRTAPPAPRAALAGAVLLVAGWITVLLGGGVHAHADGSDPATAAGPPLGALGGAGSLDLVAALVLAVGLRRGSTAGSAEPTPLHFLLSTAVGAGAVAVAVSMSLAGLTLGASHLH